jgi:hypothetical protein
MQQSLAHLLENILTASKICIGIVHDKKFVCSMFCTIQIDIDMLNILRLRILFQHCTYACLPEYKCFTQPAL